MKYLIFTFILGTGATAVLDLWSIARKSFFGVALPNYGLVGRWIAYMPFGRFHHNSIAKAAPIRGELIIGWAVHYLTGIAFAALLIGIWGHEWIRNPTIGPAIVVGIGTVVIPFLLMQPGMGAGIAASKTPRPTAARLQSLVTHAVFGVGLYLTGVVLQLAYPA